MRKSNIPHVTIWRCHKFWLFVFMVFVSVSVNGFIPPVADVDSNEDEWESVHDLRRRLNIDYNYTPSLLHAEMCRYLTEEECVDADQSMQAHARSLRKISRQRQLNPSIGVFKVVVILLQFTDHSHQSLLDPEIFSEIWNGKERGDLIPSGSISEWFEKNSYGLYEMEATVVNWTLSDNTEEYYSFGNSGLSLEFQRSFWPALDKLDRTEGWDWSDFDADGDGKLDAVVVLHSGYAAELKGEDCNTKREYVNRIWSHAYSQSINPWESADGQYQLQGYVVASAFRNRCGDLPARIGTMTHEFMHTFGLVDLYDGQDAAVGKGVGGFDIMATPYGPKNDPSWPGHLSTWSRMEVGWLEPIEILEDGQYSIQAAEISNQAYVIRKPYPDMEYLLIENRQPLWFDARLWTGGLVMYHIDDKAPLQLKRGYPGQDGWPRNGNHYQVAVLGADGQYDLEQGDNIGDVGDFWLEGMSLGPGNGRVFPNTDAYQFGLVRSTGVTINDIKTIDTIMTFRVSGMSDIDSDSGDAYPYPTSQPTVASAGPISPLSEPSATSSPTPEPTAAGLPRAIGTSSAKLIVLQTWNFVFLAVVLFI